MSARKRGAFTLVELLVVMAIMGILMGLLIVAVGAATNAANRAKSTNNQKEIAQALQMYEARKGRFPGYVQRIAFPPSTPNNVASWRLAPWSVVILPYLDGQSVYDTWVDLNQTPLEPTLPVFLCPGDDQLTAAGPYTSYVVNGGTPDGPITGTVASPSSPLDSRDRGIFHNHDPRVQRADVDSGFVQMKDGSAQTLLVSENIRADRWTNTEEYLACFLWETTSGAIDQEYEIPINQINPATKQKLFATATDKNGARLNAPHPGGVIVTFVDGHAMFLADRVSADVYNKLCTPNGAAVGQTILDAADFN